jgi:hypothetical protein
MPVIPVEMFEGRTREQRERFSQAVTQAIVGHSTAAMHLHYSHVDAGEKRAAVGRVVSLIRSTPGLDGGDEGI